MRVAGLDSNGDWKFGKGRANYLRRSNAIAQHVVTRLRSFTDDWFADIDNGLPWFELLGNRATSARILREIETAVLATEGVRAIERLRLVSVDANRKATIELTYVDVFNTKFVDTVVLP